MKMKLLLVEDSVARAIALADALEREGAEVALAHTASDAALRLARTRPDVLVLSASLPVVTFAGLLRKARSECPRMRIVLINARLSDLAKLAEFAPDATFDNSTAAEIIVAVRRLLAA